MSTYELLLSAHILFVITWLGGTVCIQVLTLRARRMTPMRMADSMADAEWLGHRVLGPAALGTVVFGAWLATELGYDFSDTWIVLALAAVAFSFLVGALYLDPESGRIQKLVAERGYEHPTVQARVRRVVLVSRVELLILLAVVVDMVVKPGV